MQTTTTTTTTEKILKRKDLSPYKHQVAGHITDEGWRAFLSDNVNHILYKPFKTQSCDNPMKNHEKSEFKNNREIVFYEKEVALLLPELFSWIPKFYGVNLIQDEDGGSFSMQIIHSC